MENLFLHSLIAMHYAFYVVTGHGCSRINEVLDGTPQAKFKQLCLMACNYPPFS